MSILNRVLGALLTWILGEDEEYPSLPARISGKGVILLLVLGAGFAIPAISIAIGILISRFDGIWWVWIALGIVFLGVVAFWLFLWAAGSRVIPIFIAALTVLGVLATVWKDPVDAARIIIFLGLLASAPILVLAGGAVAAMTDILIVAFKAAGSDILSSRVDRVLRGYFGLLVWLYVFGEICILIGVDASNKALAYGFLAGLISCLAAYAWGMWVGKGRTVVLWTQATILLCVLWVSIPPSAWVFLPGAPGRQYSRVVHSIQGKEEAFAVRELRNIEGRAATVDNREELRSVKKELTDWQGDRSEDKLQYLKDKFAR